MRDAGDRADVVIASLDAGDDQHDRAVAHLAAQLRARHRSLRLPDALALAAALGSDTEFLSLDQRLRRIAGREEPLIGSSGPAVADVCG